MGESPAYSPFTEMDAPGGWVETVKVSSSWITLGTFTETQLLNSRTIPVISCAAGAFRGLCLEWMIEGFSMALLAGEVS